MLNFYIFYCFSPLLDSKSYQIKDYVLNVMFTMYLQCPYQEVSSYFYLCVCVCSSSFFCGKIYIKTFLKYI